MTPREQFLKSLEDYKKNPEVVVKRLIKALDRSLWWTSDDAPLYDELAKILDGKRDNEGKTE